MELFPVEIDDGVHVIRAEGGIDGRNAERFLDEVTALVDGGARRMVIDRAAWTSSPCRALRPPPRPWSPAATRWRSEDRRCPWRLRVLQITALNESSIFTGRGRAKLFRIPTLTRPKVISSGKRTCSQKLCDGHHHRLWSGAEAPGSGGPASRRPVTPA